MTMSIRKLAFFIAFLAVTASSLCIAQVNAWEWDELWAGGSVGGLFPTLSSSSTLSMEQVSEMRVRDLKRRLTRSHGYSADEVGRMLDKRELIETLAFEEEKVRLTEMAGLKRELLQKSILVALAAIVIVIFWPLLRQAYDAISVNIVIYTDRKRYEARRCGQLKSYQAMIGVGIMMILDFLQFWLSASVLLSWFIKRNRYFFPTPNIPVSTSMLSGAGSGGSSKVPLSGFSINIGSMLVTWALRFANQRVEGWTGRALLRAQKAVRKEKRQNETEEERVQRKAAKKLAKQKARAEAEAASAAAREAQASLLSFPANELPETWIQPADLAESSPGKEMSSPEAVPQQKASAPCPVPLTAAHQEFLDQIEIHSSCLDEMD